MWKSSMRTAASGTDSFRLRARAKDPSTPAKLQRAVSCASANMFLLVTSLGQSNVIDAGVDHLFKTFVMDKCSF
jgi:hypothetical protein